MFQNTMQQLTSALLGPLNALTLAVVFANQKHSAAGKWEVTSKTIPNGVMVAFTFNGGTQTTTLILESSESVRLFKAQIEAWTDGIFDHISEFEQAKLEAQEAQDVSSILASLTPAQQQALMKRLGAAVESNVSAGLAGARTEFTRRPPVIKPTPRPSFQTGGQAIRTLGELMAKINGQG